MPQCGQLLFPFPAQTCMLNLPASFPACVLYLPCVPRSDNLASKFTKAEGRWGDDIFIAAPGEPVVRAGPAQSAAAPVCAPHVQAVHYNPHSVPLPVLPHPACTAVGSTLYLNKLPPESVASIFPRASNTQEYQAPPPAAPVPTPNSASKPFMVGGEVAGQAGWPLSWQAGRGPLWVFIMALLCQLEGRQRCCAAGC
jgi:hypothetical protein